MSKNNSRKDIPLREQIKPIFKERFKEMLGSEEDYLKFVETILKPQRKSFRINTLKVKDTSILLNNLKEKGFILEKIPWSKHSYYTKFNENIRTDLGNLFEHFLGEIYVQESTSMTPPELLEIPFNIEDLDEFKVLDMASSPGSKTTQLGVYMNNEGLLIANELDYLRLGPLKINLERAGLTNVVITNMDASRIQGFEKFDRILLDAPCSGSGVIRKSPKTIKTYNPKRLNFISKLQQKLIQRAFELLKIGGVMTYSTCSLDPEENEFVIKTFLENNEKAILEKAELSGLILTHKIKEFKGIKIPSLIYENTIRIWPQDNDTNGFFVAKIRKIK